MRVLQVVVAQSIDRTLQESSNSKKKITANGIFKMLQDVNTLKTQNEELTKDNKKYQKIKSQGPRKTASRQSLLVINLTKRQEKISQEAESKGQKATKTSSL